MRACLKLLKSERVACWLLLVGLYFAASAFMLEMVSLPNACFGLLPDLVSAVLASGAKTTKAVFSILPLRSERMRDWFSTLS